MRGGPAAAAPATFAPQPVRLVPQPATTNAEALLGLLGGRSNILDLAAVPGRLLLKLARTDVVDDQALAGLGVRAVARPGTGLLHLLISGPVESTAAPLQSLLR